jgi:hypothetical protein
MSSQPQTQPGQDTPTGTDPDAKYDTPGYEDKSIGQAGNQDQALVEKLVRETDGDLDEATKRFAEESAGAPALARQEADDDSAEDHATGREKAAENRADDPPA